MMELLDDRKNKFRELPIYMNNIEELIKWKFEGIYDEERNLGQRFGSLLKWQIIILNLGGWSKLTFVMFGRVNPISSRHG